MRTLGLSFEGGELIQVSFREGVSAPDRISVRGKAPGAYRNVGTFQWTSAVRAFALLALKATVNPQHARIHGGSGSLASSLDYALSKQPQWLVDLFGCDREGISYARRMFLRTNPERKRPGPVVLALNAAYLPSSAIKIHIGNNPACPENALALHDLLAEQEPMFDLKDACPTLTRRAVGE